MHARYTITTATALAILLVASLAPSAAATDATTTINDTQSLGGASIHSWTKTDASGNVVALGVTFPAALLNALPAEPTETVLQIPHAARQTPFTHIAIDWNPKGHEPEAIYGLPHFDAHFYTISEPVRAAITATGEDLKRIEMKPDPQTVPAGYVATPGGVPRMGAHWIDPKSPEFNGQRFTQTFIYGFYDGRMAFAEPMFTREYLLTKPQLEEPIAQPAVYPPGKRFPTGYVISYDPQEQTYTIALTGLTAR